MNHFEEILYQGQGQGLHQNNYHENQELYNRSTNQSNLILTAVQQIQSLFDSSPKASMFFFSLHSPKQNTDNFQFNNQNSHLCKYSKDHIQPISRRLQFQEEASQLCKQEEIKEEQNQIKQEEQWNFQSQETPPKGKKIKKNKNSKGLKNLSVGVYQIVSEQIYTSYREVANTLINKLNKKAKEQSNHQAGVKLLKSVQKDQHNIKRRVYDALNVLISAQLLRKEGKRVICNTISQQKQGKNEELQRQRQNLNKQVNERILKLQQKKNQLQMLPSKLNKIKCLIERNKKISEKQQNVIYLPFIVLKSSLQNTIMISFGKTDVEIKYSGNILIMGDVDTIEELQDSSISL